MEEVVAGRRHLRIEDWEREVGAQVRELRLRTNRSQKDLAGAANVSVSSVQNLEGGRGSSLRTLISVLRALGRESWLEQIAPPVAVSPIAMLRERQRAEATRRKRARRRVP